MGVSMGVSRCRVAIVGAGPAGSATALALAKAGVDGVVLLDRPAKGHLRIGETVPPAVGPLLRRLGLCDDLATLGHLPCYGTLSAWGGEQPHVDEFLRRGLGIGWHLNRGAFDAWLAESAVSAGVCRWAPTIVTSVEARANDGYHLRCRALHEGAATAFPELIADIVVDATGRSAFLATRLGARRTRLDQLIALAAFTVPAEEAPFQGFSTVEAAPQGWWYTARVPGGAAIVSLMTDHDLARQQRLQQPQVLRERWLETQLLSRMAQPPALPFKPVAFSATTHYLDRACGRTPSGGWVAVGDALLALDPLSSTGIAGAIEDGLAAADLILAWQRSDADQDQAEHCYTRRFDEMRLRYLRERREIYSRERRWGGEPFWQRRAVAEKVDDQGSDHPPRLWRREEMVARRRIPIT